MGRQVHGSFEVSSWEENPSPALEEAGKVSVARIGQRFSGAIEAETIADLVMTYRPDGTADFLGYQRVQGRLEGRPGSVVLRASGSYDGKEARTELGFVAGSGTGSFAGVGGRGEAVAPVGPRGTYRFELDS